MTAIDFYTHLIGADRPVGQSLAKLFSEESFAHKCVSLEARERPFLQLQSSARPVYLLTPSPYHPQDLDDALFWVDLAKEEDAVVFLLSTLSMCDTPDSEVVHENWKNFSQDELSQQYYQLEERVRQNTQNVILRVGQLFSFGAEDFAGHLLSLIRHESEIALDGQRLFEPTPADDVASVVIAMLRQISCSSSLWGTYHFSGVESVSSYAFAEAILAEAGQYEDFSGCTLLDQDNRLTPLIWTPVSEHHKLFHTFGIKSKSWRSGMSRLVRQYYRAGF